jgi:hypothetical protein
MIWRHGDANHTVEAARLVAVPAPADHEEPKRTDTGPHHFADISAVIRLLLRDEIAAVGIIEIARDRQNRTRNQRPPVPVECPDRFDLRQALLRPLQAKKQVRLPRTNLFVGESSQHLVHFRDRALDRLNSFERVLLKHVERALDAFVRLGVGRLPLG